MNDAAGDARWEDLVVRLAAEETGRTGPLTVDLVRRVVVAEADRLADAPVQAYVDLLVARAARRRLRGTPCRPEVRT